MILLGTNMKKKLEAICSGTVQGVFFRQFVTNFANANGIVGTVQNKSDGTVFIIAEGEENTLQEFIEELYKGSEYANVSDIKITWSEPTSQYSDFRVV